ncbi:HNH endonuclease [Psychrosphaera sp. 1_MG-2023]|uniref:HNH endonuclease n=1 Tax=Psychrosphaera sp. 1_MG-2023 TaxID=3062643 RepID=UPI0026E23D05|nr:HNH endonuclease [Psychrosphaera sp. 1_MG-2023]MDO6718825.1 HNH endonuclease [Psychrosphaera sp. 1_MG-2023]
MPSRPGKACRKHNCSAVVRERKWQGFCELHKDESGWFNNEKLKGNRHQRGYGRRWEIDRRDALRRDKGLCVVCRNNGRTTAATQVDHIVPKEHGGTDDQSNLQSICDCCHLRKTATESHGRGGQNL